MKESPFQGVRNFNDQDDRPLLLTIEPGVDGDRLFRSFLSELLKTSFDSNRGFLRLTKNIMLFSNAVVYLLVEDFPKHYYFILVIYGKIFYVNLPVELSFADFFSNLNLFGLVGFSYVKEFI